MTNSKLVVVVILRAALSSVVVACGIFWVNYILKIPFNELAVAVWFIIAMIFFWRIDFPKRRWGSKGRM
jgi:hypothetical protein